jgi:hypothetical protein
MSILKALASACMETSLRAESTTNDSPFLFFTLENLFVSFFTQPGTYMEYPFFHEPNHNTTKCRSCFLAP